MANATKQHQRSAPGAPRRSQPGYMQAEGEEVDWDFIAQQLNDIPADFKSQKFNSLKRVIEILSAPNPHLALNELKTELEVCESMIDSVVDSYHLGFNHAIQNYSKILKLFQESQVQVRSVKASLEEARLRLGTHSSNLRTHWHTAMSLKDSISILHDVRRVVDDQAALELTLARKDWLQASIVLLRLANRLAIEDLQRLGALSEIRGNLVKHWNTIVSSLVAEILEMVFRRPPALQVPAKASQGAADLGASALLTQQSSADTEVVGGSSSVLSATGDLSDPGNGRASTAALVSYHPRIAAAVYELKQHTAESASAALETLSLKDTAEAKRKVAAQQLGDVKVQQLLTGLINLDSLHVLKRRLLSSVVPEIKKVMEAAMTSALATGVERPLDDSAAQTHYFVPEAVHKSVQRVIKHAFSQVLLVVRNLGVLFDLAATAGEGLAAARRRGGQGMSLLQSLDPDATVRSQRRESLAAPGDEVSGIVQAASQEASAERDVVWMCIQDEVLAFLAVLIRAPRAKALTKHEPDLEIDGEGRGAWLASILKDNIFRVPAGQRKSKLVFQFESEDDASTTLLASSPTGRALRRGEEEGDAYASLVASMTLGTPASPYLTPDVHPTLLHFCQEVGALLGLGPTSDKRVQAQRATLLSFLDDFVAETVLHRVWVDAKAHVAQLLADKYAFRVAGHQRQTARGAHAGRPVLPAVLGAEMLLEELAYWAELMPMYAEPLCSIATNMLLRLIDEADQVLSSLVTSSTVKSLAASSAVSSLLVRQAAAAHLGDVAFFQAAKGPDSAESQGFAQRHAPLLGRGGDADFEELLVYYLALRPIPVDDLMQAQGNMTNLVNIAALAHSSIYLADMLQRHASKLVPGGSGDGERSLWHGFRTQTLASTVSSVSSPRDSPRSPLASAVPASAGLPTNLQHVVERLKSEAGQCVRALKLDVHLFVVSRVADLRRCRKLVSEDSMRDMDTSLSLLLRHVQRLEEQLAPYLPPEQLHFLLDDLPGLACKALVAVLPEVEEVNRFGLDRMIRWMSVVKASMALSERSTRTPALLVVQAQQQQQYDASAAFCALLRGSVSSVLVDAQDDFGKLSVREWRSLLDVPVTGRSVTQAHRQTLDGIVESNKASLKASVDESSKTDGTGGSPTSATASMANWLSLPARTKSTMN